MNSFSDLVSQFGSPQSIPDRQLYDLISNEVAKTQIEECANQGLAKLFAQPLVVEVRRRAKADLYFLNKYFLWDSSPVSGGQEISFNKVNRAVHQVLADVFVKKDDTKEIEHQDDICKERVVLYPRGSFKSTFDIADTVQWILNFPEIRILYLTATDDLAVGFVDETKGYFVIRQNPSLMNLYFPEYCLDEKKLGPADSFTCPLWAAKKIKRKEPTIWSRSIGSTMSGFHFEVMKLDDAIETRNTQTEDQCLKIIKTINLNLKMLMPWGYKDYIGTRYSEEDFYGDWIRRNVGELEIHTGMENKIDPRPWTLTNNKTTGTKLLVGTAWKVKDEAELKIIKGELKSSDLGFEHYFILFPEQLSYSVLRQKLQSEGEASFESQYNQNPRPTSKIIFDILLLKSHTIPFNELPMAGPIAITWDLAFTSHKDSDYSTAAVGQFNEAGKLYVIDLVRDRFNPTTIAKAVVDLAIKWNPIIIGIEDAAGSKLSDPTIQSFALRSGRPNIVQVCKQIDWFKPLNQKGAKRQRIASLHPWLIENKLFFASYLPYIDTLYEEFQRCLTTHHHDDIPDAISNLLRYTPKLELAVTVAKQNKQILLNRDEIAWRMVMEEGFQHSGGGYLIGHNPETGEFELQVDPITAPTLIPIDKVEEQDPKAESPYENSVLGHGLFG